ncbi:unnamed protein product [Leuciscus chuanchicus]
MKAVIILFIFITLCLISGQVLCFSVSGCTGGSLMFKCMISNQRETDDQHKGKYFCRDRSSEILTPPLRSYALISTDVQSRWVYNGRFALYDDGNSRFFTVFIRNINREDDGDYTYGNNQTWNQYVTLVESKESRCGTSVIRDGYLGQKTITFRCEYDEKFKTHTKVFYRLNEDPVHILNSSRSSQSSEEKFSLSDSHNDHFTVTIRDISAADGGVYLCGVERGESHQSSTHITFIKEIQLNVYGKITSVQVQAYSSKSVFITCKFPQKFKGNKKFIQKDSSQKIFVEEQNQWVHHDKVHMYDDSSEGRLKVFISDLTAADEATYRYGVNITDHDLFTEIKLTVNQVDHFPASSNTSAIIGESVKLTCNFPEKHDETFTHICKENKEKICESISSSEKKRFEFSASPAGVFTVSISNVSVRDAGVYWCGAETRDTHLTSVSLTNQHQLTPTMVGREGDSSEIKCPYDENHSTEIKHLCKGKCFTKDAKKIIQSDEAHVNNPKISVKNETELNLFTVTLSDLRAEDAGIYWCAVKEAFNLPIELMIVLKDALFTHEASVGGSVSISCKNVRTQTQRLFCRGDQPNICVRDGVRVSSNTRTNGRFSLTDETSAGVFTVNISNLTEEDSGKYWCAEETSGSFVFTEVHLHVTQDFNIQHAKHNHGKSIGSYTKSRRTGSYQNHSTTCVLVFFNVGVLTRSYTLLVRFSNTVTMVENTETRSAQTRSRERSAAERQIRRDRLQSDTYTPVGSGPPYRVTTSWSTRIYKYADSQTVRGPRVSASAIIIIIILSTPLHFYNVSLHFLISFSPAKTGIEKNLLFSVPNVSPTTSPRKKTKTSQDEGESGKIQQIHCLVQDSDPTSTPLYSTVQLPTNPSDSQNPLYSSVQLPTIPSDSQNPLYSTGQLPTIPSDSQNPLYSTVQLPTIPSDSQNPLY